MQFLTYEQEVWCYTFSGPTFTKFWILNHWFQQMCKQKDALLCFWQFLKPKWRTEELIKWRPSGSKLLPLQQSQLTLNQCLTVTVAGEDVSQPSVDTTLLCLPFFTCKALTLHAGVSFSFVTRSSYLDVSWVRRHSANGKNIPCTGMTLMPLLFRRLESTRPHWNLWYI